jgi:hypothetical protein
VEVEDLPLAGMPCLQTDYFERDVIPRRFTSKMNNGKFVNGDEFIASSAGKIVFLTFNIQMSIVA